MALSQMSCPCQLTSLQRTMRICILIEYAVYFFNDRLESLQKLFNVDPTFEASDANPFM